MHQIKLASSSIAKDLEEHSSVHVVTDDIAYQRLLMVNVCFIGEANAADRTWFLVDAGLFGSASFIKKAAAERFGEDSRPGAIFLTHGHFDHVGALKSLAEDWDVPVYAHQLEFPYLNGSDSYPPPDPSVGGGMMATLSFLYPNSPIDISSRLQPLPHDGTVPGLGDWEWIPTPGHSPGHVSFWREVDKTLIAGDAVITTNQESAYGVITQEAEIHGPPQYFTPDWINAKRSVQKIEKLQPRLLISGHGRAVTGGEINTGLLKLSKNFREIAVPESGKYVDQTKY